MNLNGVKVLVTGGAGFIGSYTVDELLDWGANVRLFDNFERSLFSYEGIENMKKQILGERLEIMRGDLRNIKDCDLACQGMHYVIHAGALSDVKESMQNPYLYDQVNVQGTENILECAIKHKVRRIVFASTSLVYGDKEGIVEESAQVNPQSFYAATKSFSELRIKAQSDRELIQGINLRYFNVYGDGQPSKTGAVIPTFIGAVFNNEPVTIFGDGNQIRDFIYVKDVAIANRIALTEGENGATYNICHQTMPIKELYDAIRDLSNTKHHQVVYKKALKGDIKGFKGSLSLTHHQLGFSARTAFENGLTSTIRRYADINYSKSNLQGGF